MEARRRASILQVHPRGAQILPSALVWVLFLIITGNDNRWDLYLAGPVAHHHGATDDGTPPLLSDRHPVVVLLQQGCRVDLPVRPPHLCRVMQRPCGEDGWTACGGAARQHLRGFVDTPGGDNRQPAR